MKGVLLTLLMTVACNYFSLAHDNLCWTNPNDFLRHPEDCHKFIRCSQGRAYVFNCPSNLVWHHEIKSCDYIYRTRCTVNTQEVKKNDVKLKKQLSGFDNECDKVKCKNYREENVKDLKKLKPPIDIALLITKTTKMPRVIKTLVKNNQNYMNTSRETAGSAERLKLNAKHNTMVVLTTLLDAFTEPTNTNRETKEISKQMQTQEISLQTLNEQRKDTIANNGHFSKIFKKLSKKCHQNIKNNNENTTIQLKIAANDKITEEEHKNISNIMRYTISADNFAENTYFLTPSRRVLPVLKEDVISTLNQSDKRTFKIIEGKRENRTTVMKNVSSPTTFSLNAMTILKDLPKVLKDKNDCLKKAPLTGSISGYSGKNPTEPTDEKNVKITLNADELAKSLPLAEYSHTTKTFKDFNVTGIDAVNTTAAESDKGVEVSNTDYNLAQTSFLITNNKEDNFFYNDITTYMKNNSEDSKSTAFNSGFTESYPKASSVNTFTDLTIQTTGTAKELLSETALNFTRNPFESDFIEHQTDYVNIQQSSVISINLTEISTETKDKAKLAKDSAKTLNNKLNLKENDLDVYILKEKFAENITDIIATDFTSFGTTYKPSTVSVEDITEKFSKEITVTTAVTITDIDETSTESTVQANDNKKATTGGLFKDIISNIEEKSTTAESFLGYTKNWPGFTSTTAPIASYLYSIGYTTQDPRLPFRSLECQGENNRRQLKAFKCYQYYQCFAGWAFLLNCHEDWWFHPTKGQCVLDIKNECEF